MHIQLLTQTDTNPNHLWATITLTDGALVVDSEDKEGLKNLLGKSWPVRIDRTERDVDPHQEPELFLRHAYRIFKSAYLRATRVRET